MSCMEESIARDAKANLMALAHMLDFPRELVEKIEVWKHD